MLLVRPLQEAVFTAWIFAIPAVAVGFALNAIPLLSAGAWSLLAAVIVSAAGLWDVAGPAVADFRQPAGDARQALNTSR